MVLVRAHGPQGVTGDAAGLRRGHADEAGELSREPRRRPVAEIEAEVVLGVHGPILPLR